MAPHHGNFQSLLWFMYESDNANCGDIGLHVECRVIIIIIIIIIIMILAFLKTSRGKPWT